MCIICNLEDPSAGLDEADRFLKRFAEASKAMKAAAAELDAVTKLVREPHRSRYKQTHHKMVRLMREWNRLEQEREAGHDVVDIETIRKLAPTKKRLALELAQRPHDQG